MSTKSLFKIVSVLMMVAFVFSGCSPANTQTPTQESVPVTIADSESSTTDAEATVEEAPEISGKITVWGWKAGIDAMTNAGLLDRFAEKYPGVEVEIVVYDNNSIYQKLPLAIQSGTGAPDIAFVENSHLAKYVALGGLTDLTDKVTPYVDKMNAYKWADAIKDGSYYAMPWDSGPVVLYYRRDVFEAAGLSSDPESVSELVATWEDYFNTCQIIKEQTGCDCFANNKANNYARLYEMILWQQGLGYYDANGNVTVDSAENIATLEMMKKFWDANLASDQLEWSDGWYAEMASTTIDKKPVATLLEAAWMGAFLKGWIATGTEGKWGVALMPAMEAGQARSSNDGGTSLVIPDQSENKDAAWAFVEFMLGDVDSQVAIFTAGDIFPALEAAYDDPIFQEADPFFGDQTVRETYIDVVKEIPVGYVYGPYYQDMGGYVQTAIQKVATDQMSVADALKEAADAIRQQTGLQ